MVNGIFIGQEATEQVFYKYTEWKYKMGSIQLFTKILISKYMSKNKQSDNFYRR